MIKLLDTKILAATETAYLHLLDRVGVMKGDLLAALLIGHLALSPFSVPAIAFKLLCLVTCLQLSNLQRSRQLRMVNAMAEWLRSMTVLRMIMMVIAVSHVLREPGIEVVAAQFVGLAAAYLFCVKVRERRTLDLRHGAWRPRFV